MKILMVIFCMFLTIQLSICQSIDKWHDYLSYNNCFTIDESGGNVYGVCSTGIIRANTTSGTTDVFSKVNGLSDVSITAFLALEGSDFIVGYENGNIDLYYNNRFTNVFDIKNKSIVGSKNICSFSRINSLIYICTKFGVVVYDIVKQEVKDTWNFGYEVDGLVLYNGKFVIATKKGLLQSDKDNPMISYEASWSIFSEDSNPYVSIKILNNRLIAVRNTSIYDILYYSDERWNTLETLSNFSDLKVSKDKLLVISNSKIEVYSSELELLSTKNGIVYESSDVTTSNFTSANYSTDNHLWFTDTYLGLLKCDDYDVSYTPNCPSSNDCYQVSFLDNKLVVCAGGRTSGLNSLWRAAGVYFYDNNWRYLDASNTKLFSGMFDIISVCANPKDSSQMFFSSWGCGVFEVKDTVKIRYDQNNSTLKTIEWAGENYIRVGGSLMDEDGNLFINNSYVNNGLAVRTKNGDWLAYNYPGIYTGWLGNIIQDPNSKYIWFNKRVAEKGDGLFVFDINKTINDPSDDRYRGPMDKGQDIDNRNAGALKLMDQNGEVVTQTVYSYVFDKDGYLWVGTDKGVLVNYRPVYVFDDPQPIFNRIQIPRNDGTDNVDYLLENESITAIAIDGANRKWIGTLSSGVYLISEDGTKTICNFNEDNSPLISNSINSITINPSTGEVFIATTKGLVSFEGEAIEGKKSLSGIYAYPNPVRPDYHGNIKITGLMSDCIVKITDLNGHLVCETTSLGGNAIWDGRNAWGQEVKSGIYLAYVTDEKGENVAIVKIMIIR
jgi:hypothetical protein